MAKKNKGPFKKEVKHYVDLLYMTPLEVHSKDLSLLFGKNTDIEVQLWEEFHVLELELPTKNTVDLENIEVQFKDPSDASFVKNRNIKTIYAIHLCEEDLETFVNYFEPIIEQYQGFLCADSDDFNPVYLGSTKR